MPVAAPARTWRDRPWDRTCPRAIDLDLPRFRPRLGRIWHDSLGFQQKRRDTNFAKRREFAAKKGTSSAKSRNLYGSRRERRERLSDVSGRTMVCLLLKILLPRERENCHAEVRLSVFPGRPVSRSFFHSQELATGKSPAPADRNVDATTRPAGHSGASRRPAIGRRPLYGVRSRIRLHLSTSPGKVLCPQDYSRHFICPGDI